MAKTNRIEKATRIAVNPMFTISLQISTLALQRQSAANGIRVETMSQQLVKPSENTHLHGGFIWQMIPSSDSLQLGIRGESYRNPQTERRLGPKKNLHHKPRGANHRHNLLPAQKQPQKKEPKKRVLLMAINHPPSLKCDHNNQHLHLCKLTRMAYTYKYRDRNIYIYLNTNPSLWSSRARTGCPSSCLSPNQIGMNEI